MERATDEQIENRKAEAVRKAVASGHTFREWEQYDGGVHSSCVNEGCGATAQIGSGPYGTVIGTATWNSDVTRCPLKRGAVSTSS